MEGGFVAAAFLAFTLAFLPLSVIIVVTLLSRPVRAEFDAPPQPSQVQVPSQPLTALISKTHYWLRDTALFLFCVCFYKLMTLIHAADVPDPGIVFPIVAFGFALAFLGALCTLCFHLYSPMLAVGICLLALPLWPVAFLLVDRKSVHYLRANGINPEWLDQFRFGKQQ